MVFPVRGRRVADLMAGEVRVGICSWADPALIEERHRAKIAELRPRWGAASGRRGKVTPDRRDLAEIPDRVGETDAVAGRAPGEQLRAKNEYQRH